MSYNVDFNGGTDGGTVATGGAITARTGTPTYNAANAIHGDRAMFCSSGTSTTCIRCDTAPSTHSGSTYVKFPVAPDAAFRFLNFGNIANTTSICNVHINTTRVLQLSNATTAIQVTGAVVIPVGQEVRIDWQLNNSDTANPILTVRLFLDSEGSVHDEELTFTFAGTVNTFERINYGIIGGAAVTNRQIYMDTIRVVDGLTWATAFDPPPSTENVIWGPADFYQSGNSNVVQATAHVPAGTMAGDILIAALVVGATQSPAPAMPTGFATIVAVQNLTNATVVFASRVAPGTPGNPSTIADTDITFSWNTPGKAALLLALAGGEDQAAAISDAAVGTVASSTTTHASPATTATVSGRVVRIAALFGGLVEQLTKPASTTLRGAVYGRKTNGSIAIADSGTNAAIGAIAAANWTSDVPTGVGAMLTFVLKPQVASIGARRFWGITKHMTGGAATQTSFKVYARMIGATSVRLAYSVNADMSSPSFISAQVPDSDGYVRFTVPTLVAGTTYYYQLMDTPPANSEAAVSLIGKIKTLKASGSQLDFKFAFGANQVGDSNVGSAHTNLVAWDPDFVLHLGNLHDYRPAETVALTHQRYFESQIDNAAGLKTLLRNAAFFYGRGDNDSQSIEDGDSNVPANQASIDAAKNVFPYSTLGDTRSPTVGLYHSFVVGRVRFIWIDVRNMERLPGSNPQGASKTALGSIQKAWLKARLLEPEPIKVIVSDTAWNHSASITDDKASWWSYDDERTEIGNFIEVNDLRVYMVTGNDQKLHADDGTNNSHGGFDVVGAAPFDNVGNGFSVAQSSYNTGAVRGAQYGRVEVTDLGQTIEFEYTGWDAISNTSKVSMTTVFDVDSPDILVGAGNETSATSASSQSIAVTRPANVDIDDPNEYMIAQVFNRTAAANGFVTQPDGWLRVGPLVNTNYTMATYIKKTDAGDTPGKTYTWAITAAAGRTVARINRLVRAHATAPVDIAGIDADHSGTTSITLPGVDPETTNNLLVGFIGMGRSNVIPSTVTPPTGMTLFGATTADDGASSSSIAGVKQLLGNDNPTGDKVAGLSPSSVNSVGYLLAFRATNASVAPTVAMICSGGITPTSAQISFRVLNGASVRLVVSLASDMSDPIYSDVTIPTADGFGKLNITGLTVDTQYWYRLEVNGTVMPTHQGKFKTFPATANFSFLAASCAVTGSNDPIFTNMKDRVGDNTLKPIFFAHLGDWDYTWGNGGITPDDAPQITAARMVAFTAPLQAELYQEIPLDYVWSDVDFGGSNSDGTSVAGETMQTLYRKIWPSYPLPSTEGGIQRAWSIGRVRFIHTDGRSLSTSKAGTDDASKTLLGLEQKAWLKAEMQQATDDGKVVVWFHDNNWDGSPSTGLDNWQGYTTERQEIADFITTNSIPVYYIHGDTHTLFADDGTNNPFGGFPLACVAPMHQQANATPRTYTAGSYPVSTVTTAHQYGWFEVADDGTDITFLMKGFDGDGTERITQTIVFTPTSAAQPVLTRWNGTSEEPLVVDGIWNGTTIVPAQLSLSE